jgi:ParB-like chromosome segregation protein Spo0J
MARKLSIDVSADVEVIPQQYRNGTALSEVKKVAPSVLRMNDKNTEYFAEESEEYFTNLRDDIRQRGVIVPLIAKTNGTLLAGHNRLRIAQELKLPQVPVQYVLEDLSEEREREFIIKDNLFRRQLDTEEWVELYRRLYPDFDAVFFDKKTKVAQGRIKAGESRLTIRTIAEETGQKYDTVKTQIRRARDSKNSKSVVSSKKSEKGFSEPFSKNGSDVEQKKIDKELRTAVKSIVENAEKASPSVQQEIRKRLMKFLK